MDKFLRTKLDRLREEREELHALLATSDDLMVSGLVQQEIRRNEKLSGIYAATLEQHGWTNG